MFKKIENLILKVFTDMQSTFIWIFAIGILLCAVMVWQGGEENKPKFKSGLIFCVIGIVIFLLAKPMVEYVRTNL